MDKSSLTPLMGCWLGRGGKALCLVVLVHVFSSLPASNGFLGLSWALQNFGPKELPAVLGVARAAAPQQSLSPGSQPFSARVNKTFKHSYRVFSMSFSPDGKRVATGGILSNRMNVWNVETGQLVHDLSGLMGAVNSLSYSPDGQYLAAGMGFVGTSEKDISVYVWDAHTGQLVHGLKGSAQGGTSRRGRNNVSTVGFSPDSKLLAVGYENDTIAISDTKTGQLLKKWPASSGFASPLIFSPDGKTLAYGGWKEAEKFAIKIVDVATGALLKTLTGHPGRADALTFSPAGQYLASAGRANIISIYEVSSQKRTQDIPTGHSGYLTSLAYSPDGRLLASGAQDGTVKVWDAKSGELVGTLRDHPDLVYAVSFNSRGDRLAAGGGEVVTLWDVSRAK